MKNIDIYQKGFREANKNLIHFVLIFLITGIILSIVNVINLIPVIGFGLAILGYILITGPIIIGINWTFIKTIRNKKKKLEHIFDVFKKNYLSAVTVTILLFLIISLGFLFLIIPGIIFMVRLAFVNYLIIDKKIDSIKAIKTSWKMTKNHFWKIFGMFLLALLILLCVTIIILSVFIGIIFLLNLLITINTFMIFIYSLIILITSIALLIGYLYAFIWIRASFTVLYNMYSTKKK